MADLVSGKGELTGDSDYAVRVLLAPLFGPGMSAEDFTCYVVVATNRKGDLMGTATNLATRDGRMRALSSAITAIADEGVVEHG